MKWPSLYALTQPLQILNWLGKTLLATHSSIVILWSSGYEFVVWDIAFISVVRSSVMDINRFHFHLYNHGRTILLIAMIMGHDGVFMSACICLFVKILTTHHLKLWKTISKAWWMEKIYILEGRPEHANVDSWMVALLRL